MFHRVDVYGVFLAIHLLMDVWVVSSFGPLQIKLLRTFVHGFLYERTLLFLLGKCLGVSG